MPLLLFLCKHTLYAYVGRYFYLTLFLSFLLLVWKMWLWIVKLLRLFVSCPLVWDDRWLKCLEVDVHCPCCFELLFLTFINLPATCDKPAIPLDSNVESISPTGSTVIAGESFTFTCIPGWETDSYELVCREDGTLDPPQPNCDRESKSVCHKYLLLNAYDVQLQVATLVAIQ